VVVVVVWLKVINVLFKVIKVYIEDNDFNDLMGWFGGYISKVVF